MQTVLSFIGLFIVTFLWLARSVVKINFEGVETVRKFEPWEQGVGHDFTIFNIESKTAKSSGNPMLEFEFKHQGSNRKAWRNYTLTPEALWALKQLLVSLGVSEEDLEGEFDFDPKDLLGEDVKLYFGPEKEFNGRMTQDIIKIEPA